jgi:hypothetical protein
MGVVNLYGMTIVAVTKSLYGDYNVILTMDRLASGVLDAQ